MKSKVLAVIVEGRGEVRAVPALLNRWIVANELAGLVRCIDQAICAGGVGRLKAAYDEKRHIGIEHYMRSAMRGNPDAVLIILDADDECLTRKRGDGLAQELLRRAKPLANGRPLGVVVADREFEAWFLAFLDHLWAEGLLAVEKCPEVDASPEAHRNCKSRMNQWLGVKYEPTTHQRRLVTGLPVSAVPESAPRSYRKLIRELHRLAEAMVGGGVA
jgi:hypothetical protein